MKKLLIFAVLLLLPLLASAGENEPLLAPDGTLFSVRTRQATETELADAGAAQYLVLDTRRGVELQSEIIPATRSKGAHGSPALAYDSESQTLFVFWLHDTGTISSELLFASLDASGVWSEATAFGMPYNVRENLRIAVTRKILDKAEEKLIPGLSVHAVWWEFDSQRVDGRWSAQYAVLGIEDGAVAEIDFFDLSTLVNGPATQVGIDVPQNSVLRHPQLFPAPSQDNVLVVFGDVGTSSLHKARLFPVKGNGRLRVPVGRAEGGAGTPNFDRTANSTMNAIAGEDDRMAFYFREKDKVHYIMLRDGVWTDARAISLDEEITAPTAVDAIRRLINEH